jgi:hypothetical protein
MMMMERKKALKKLKMKNKDPAIPKKKKEKLPRAQQNIPLFDPGFLETSKFEPVLPPAPSQIQAHNFLTGAAHLFPPEQNIFDNPSGKLITEPDKNKLNIFKKISKPKEDPKDFFQLQPSTSQQVYSDPMKKVHKLPKETTVTRVDDAPINFSMSRSESSFEELAMPKTPVPRMPEKKKEKKKKERKDEWNMQNPFMPEGNPFLQTMGNFMGNMGAFPLRNPFSLPTNELFPSGPGLIPSAPFGQFGQVGQMNTMMPSAYGFPLPGMDLNMLQQQPQPKKTKTKRDDSSLSMMPKERFEPPLMNAAAFPLQHHQQPLSTFDQLLQPQHEAPPMQPVRKIINEDKMETFDLTSSPEPMASAPEPQVVSPMVVDELKQELLAVKEKSKEKKKKKDKDKDKGEKGDK